MFNKFDYTLMETAFTWAKCSHAKRRTVGAVIAKDGRCISHGYNGRHSSQDNNCEENGKTRPDVIHAELNAILFAAKHGISTNNTVMYITCAPCMQCVPMIAAAGITKIIYKEEYNSAIGTCLDDVVSYGIELKKLI